MMHWIGWVLLAVCTVSLPYGLYLLFMWAAGWPPKPTKHPELDYWMRQELEQTPQWWDREFARLSGEPVRPGAINAWGEFTNHRTTVDLERMIRSRITSITDGDVTYSLGRHLPTKQENRRTS